MKTFRIVQVPETTLYVVAELGSDGRWWQVGPERPLSLLEARRLHLELQSGIRP